MFLVRSSTMNSASTEQSVMFSPGGQNHRLLDTWDRQELLERIGDGSQRFSDQLQDMMHTPVAVFDRVPPEEIDQIFRIRAAQLLNPTLAIGRFSIVCLEAGCSTHMVARGLAKRIASSWPFREVAFIAADKAAADRLSHELGVAVTVATVKEAISKAADGRLLSSTSAAHAGQTVAVQIQPQWGRCGSSTAFENQVETLVEQGHFVVRVFIDHAAPEDAGSPAFIQRLLRENAINAGAHLNALAFGVPEAAERVKAMGLNGYAGFTDTVRNRTECTILDPIAAAVAARASIALVNHATNVGFAIRACSGTRILLDTHDYLTRNAFELQRTTRTPTNRADLGDLLKMAKLEALLWKAADGCTCVNPTERRVIARHNPHTRIVIPRPYGPTAKDPANTAVWDILIVADQHPFNIASVQWFLRDVVAGNAFLATQRIAIVGRVKAHLETNGLVPPPNVVLFGFVENLNDIRAVSRLSVNPDQAGTGIAVKTLTAIHAGHPLVSTRIGIRGLRSLAAKLIPVADSAAEMASLLEALLSAPERLRALRQTMQRVRADELHQESFVSALNEVHGRAEDRTAFRAAVLRKLGLPHERQGPPLVSQSDRPSKKSYAVGTQIDLAEISAPIHLGDGWHAAEAWGRWTAARADAVIWLKEPVDYQANLILHLVPQSWSRGIVLSINGEALPAIDGRIEGHCLPIPLSCLGKRERLSIQLVAQHMSLPADRPASQDTRVLGVAVASIAIARRDAYGSRLWKAAGRRLSKILSTELGKAVGNWGQPMPPKAAGRQPTAGR